MRTCKECGREILANAGTCACWPVKHHDGIEAENEKLRAERDELRAEVERLRKEFNLLAWAPKKDTDCGQYVCVPVERLNEADALRRELDDAPWVYEQTSGGMQIWTRKQFDHSKERAKLVRIQPLEKKP